MQESKEKMKFMSNFRSAHLLRRQKRSDSSVQKLLCRRQTGIEFSQVTVQILNSYGSLVCLDRKFKAITAFLKTIVFIKLMSGSAGHAGIQRNCVASFGDCQLFCVIKKKLATAFFRCSGATKRLDT